ncbi:T9SS type A sorting domain-containing protein [Hanstruepera ponticola]|uniref:T9SS type A sorting domain-containing protein n=1 Tax=Hanstruepera ponticola TaxID=2042995 RepID=UPI000CF18B4E|nr:T9SS type A sorting domain-containing protein [Hanstruepera ponticola]
MKSKLLFYFLILPALYIFSYAQDASFYMTPTCDGAIATITGDPGGVFSLDPEPGDGASIHPDTGTITDGTSGATYCVTYTISGTSTVSSTECVTVLLSAFTDFIVTPTCDGGTVTLLGDPGGTFYLDPDPGDGAWVDPVTGTVGGASPGQTLTVVYEITATCGSSTSETFTVLFWDDPSFFMTPDCEGGAFATITGTPGGTFSFNPEPPDGAVIDPITGEVTGITPGFTYSVQYTTSGACGDSTIELFTADCSDVIGLVEVTAFIDENANSIFDASEVSFNGGEFTYELNDDGITRYAYTNSGNFLLSIVEEGDSYDIGFTLYDNYNVCFTQTINLIENLTATNGERVYAEFPLVPISDCDDISIYLTGASPRPGVEYNNTLIVENLGLNPISGSVEFTHDDILSLIEVVDVDTGNSITNTTSGFILNFNDLQSGNSETVTIILDVPTTANLGDIVTNSAVYSVSDLDLDNNESILTRAVVNSYDPNDKMESHGPEIVLDDFTSSDYLYYTIRFQNLGTAEAIDIRIEDVLDSQLDASTFKMLHASHDYVLTRTDNNLTWQFDDIDLPSESMDEPNSHGYVYFKIKPMAGYALGDVIPNYADIYFDFNPAITTNTFETEFVNNLSITEFDSSQFSIYPNPANDFLNVKMSNQIGSHLSVAIYDIQGKLIADELYKTDTINFQVDVSNLSTGLYVIKFYNDEFQEIKKLIID